MAMRTFLALDLDEPIRKGLVSVQRRLADCGARLRDVESANLHVTLLFLGDVADEMLADVCRIAGEAAAAIEPFDFEVRGIQAVPPRGQLRMIWANILDPSGRMQRLQETLADALAGLGLKEEERSFRPHVTLGRIKFASDPSRFRAAAGELGGLEFGIQHAEELLAYTSQLTSEGPVYTPLARAPLGR